MREIKFRAWIKAQKRMVYIEPFEYLQEIKSVTFANGKIDDGVFFDIKDVILMQFTGLHDKNGKEIYEGDVVEIIFSDGAMELGVIKWDNEYARFHWYSTKDGEAWGLHQTDIHEREVIGNIYEYPELLRG